MTITYKLALMGSSTAHVIIDGLNHLSKTVKKTSDLNMIIK